MRSSEHETGVQYIAYCIGEGRLIEPSIVGVDRREELKHCNYQLLEPCDGFNYDPVYAVFSSAHESRFDENSL
jgi:hypothetical protein